MVVLFLISLPSTICCLAINYQPIRVYLFIFSLFYFLARESLNKYAKSQREDERNPFRGQLPSIVNQNVSLHETQNCNQPPLKWSQFFDPDLEVGSHQTFTETTKQLKKKNNAIVFDSHKWHILTTVPSSGCLTTTNLERIRSGYWTHQWVMS